MTGKTGFIRFNVTKPSDLPGIIERTGSELVINASALGFESCEQNPSLAFEVNGHAVGSIAAICQRLGTRFVQLSSDYVFEGVKPMHTETDVTRPSSVYGKSKLLGERLSLDHGATIVRIALVYELPPTSRKLTLLGLVERKLTNGEAISLAADQFLTPTFAPEISLAIEALDRAQVSGVFHFATNVRTTRYEIAYEYARSRGMDTSRLYRISMAEDDFCIGKPKDSSLDTGRISKYIRTRSFSETLSEFNRHEAHSGRNSWGGTP